MTASLRSAPRALLAFPLAAVIALWPGAARSDAAVDNCQADDGPGANLATAMQAGGRIAIRCPAGSVIRISRGGYALRADTTLVGRVVLDGSQRGDRPPALIIGGAFAFAAEGVEFRNFRNTPTSFGGRGSTAQIMSDKSISLRNVAATNVERLARSRGSLEVTGGTFTGNQGVVLASDGPLVVDRSNFANNELAILIGSGRVTSSFFDNGARGSIRVDVLSGNVEIAFSKFTGQAGTSALWVTPNSRAGERHALTLHRNEFFRNDGGTEAGAVSFQPEPGLPPAQVALSQNSFSSNVGSSAGAVLLVQPGPEPAVLAGNSFRDNRATGAGGGAVRLRAGPAVVAASLFADNAADVGSGAALLADAGAELHLANSLLTRNRLPGAAGQPRAVVDVRQGSITNVTAADNDGPAMLVPSNDGAGVRVRNTVLWRNARGDCVGPAPAPAAFQGPNLQTPGGGCPGVPEGDPALDPLYAPGPASPVIAAGDPAACDAPPVGGRDLLYQARARGGCALGALERPPVRQARRVPREFFRAPSEPSFPPDPFIPAAASGASADAAEAARKALEATSALASFRAFVRIRTGEDERVLHLEQASPGRVRVVANPGGQDETEMRLVDGVLHQRTGTEWRRASGSLPSLQLPGAEGALRRLTAGMAPADPNAFGGHTAYVGPARWGVSGSAIRGTLAVVVGDAGIAVEQRFDGTCAGKACRFVQLLTPADGIVVDEPR